MNRRRRLATRRFEEHEVAPPPEYLRPEATPVDLGVCGSRRDDSGPRRPASETRARARGPRRAASETRARARGPRRVASGPRRPASETRARFWLDGRRPFVAPTAAASPTLRCSHRYSVATRPRREGFIRAPASRRARPRARRHWERDGIYCCFHISRQAPPPVVVALHGSSKRWQANLSRLLCVCRVTRASRAASRALWRVRSKFQQRGGHCLREGVQTRPLQAGEASAASVERPRLRSLRTARPRATRGPRGVDAATLARSLQGAAPPFLLVDVVGKRDTPHDVAAPHPPQRQKLPISPLRPNAFAYAGAAP